jgi:hypothetical protein
MELDPSDEVLGLWMFVWWELVWCAPDAGAANDARYWIT